MSDGGLPTPSDIHRFTAVLDLAAGGRAETKRQPPIPFGIGGFVPKLHHSCLSVGWSCQSSMDGNPLAGYSTAASGLLPA